MYKFEKQLLEESQLRAHTKVTYKTYLLRLRQFHNYIDKPLDQVYLSEIREYFLYLINVKKIGRESLRNSFYAVRFYFVYCLNFNKDRAVPIPERMLLLLREYWKTHHNQKLLFPKRKSKNKTDFNRMRTDEHIALRTVQNAEVMIPKNG